MTLGGYLQGEAFASVLSSGSFVYAALVRVYGGGKGSCARYIWSCSKKRIE